MTTIVFDSYTFVKKLTAAGFIEKQAEIFAQEQTKLIEDGLATKHDLKELKRDIKEMEMSIVIKLGAMIVALIGILVAIKLIYPA